METGLSSQIRGVICGYRKILIELGYSLTEERKMENDLPTPNMISD